MNPRASIRFLAPRRGAVVLVSIALLVAALPPGAARATPYWTELDYARSLAAELLAPLPPERGPLPQFPTYDYPAEFVQTMNFLTGLQVTDPLDPEFGGEQEAEHLRDIVQSDNTSEVIWDWSRLAARYGIDSLLYRVGYAWTYIGNFPAYLEEGPTSPDSGYYRVYNCGWALRAEMQYREATGDTGKRAYADSCANYLVANPLNLHVGPPTTLYSRLNGHVSAWAMGNLYEYGLDVGNPAYCSAAAATAESLVAWVAEDSTRLKKTAWAMAGGATFWGLIHSYFAQHPDEAGPWATRYAPSLGYYFPGGDFTLAWDAWFALGHWAAWEATGSQAELDKHQALTDSLLLEDGDADGGIPANYNDRDTQDQSWVSSYLAFMCLDNRRVYLNGVEPGALASGGSARLAARARPNPFSRETAIEFILRQASAVDGAIYDLAGRRMRTLVSSTQGPGPHALAWDGRDAAGRELAPGLYFYRLATSEGETSGKLLLRR